MDESDLIKQFDSIGSIEPSAGWNEKLFHRLEHCNNYSNTFSSNKLIMITIIILLTINVFSFTNGFSHFRKQSKEKDKMKTIAREFLIQTSSSKF
ncbi:MAG: hypothetical protein NTZ33_02710 [Bacteroidetes bacterium]|nr:hypothetical protein [Bacteroidota bacterium]